MTTIRKLLKQERFQYLLQEQQNNLAFAKGDTELQLAKARELAVALRDNPLRQALTTAASKVHEMAKSNPSPRGFEVYFAFLKLLRSLEPKIDAVGTGGQKMSLESSKFSIIKLVIPVEKLLVPVEKLVIPVDKFNVSPRNVHSTRTAIPVARASCPWPGIATAPGTETASFPYFCQTFKELHQW